MIHVRSNAIKSLELGVGLSRPQKRNSSSSVILHRCLPKLFLKLFKKLFKLNHDSSCFMIPDQSHCPSLQGLQGLQIPAGHSTLGTVLQMHSSMVPNIMKELCLAENRALHIPQILFTQFYFTHCFPFCILAIH